MVLKEQGQDLLSPEEAAQHGILMTTFEKLWDWGRSRSFWPLSYGCNCCPIEMMASGAARFDIARYGYEVFRAVPRQSDVLVIAGPVSAKMKPVVQRLYDEMPEPKWVLALGNCASSGGPFVDGYSVMPGVEELFPVDIYVPGCPPRPEALFFGLLQLKDMVRDRQKTMARARKAAAAAAAAKEVE